jgi:two-component system phosphate regulon sensor histidine kinase PhoR
MKKKINLQFVVLTLLAILTTVSLSAFVFYGLFQKEVISDLKSYTELMVETNAWEIITHPESASSTGLGDNVEQLRITLVAADGAVAYDSNADIGSMDNHSGRPEIAEAIADGEGHAIRMSKTLDKNTFYYAIRLDNGYVLRVAKETGSITGVFLSAFPVIGLICVILFLICVIMGHFLTKSLIRPIENLANHLDSSESAGVYKELVPFVMTIRRQHEDIMKNANMRQEFTANVSHELKTPLTSISGYSELIESGIADDEDVVRFARQIHKNSNRLLTLINDIIRLSELDHTATEENHEQVDLYETAKTCVELLKMNAGKNDVTLQLHGESHMAYANKQMMEELIFNLCDNAIRYNNPGGAVDITVSGNESNTVVEVKDTGIGIPKEHQERIFERFYRVDKSRSKSTGGTGLGLAIVKHILAKHENTRLELESEVGKGTCVRVIFSTGTVNIQS